MIMDWLRSCYSTNAYFLADHSRVSPLHWYFCDPVALPFPANHSFGSRRWDDAAQKLLPTVVGEIPQPRPPYSKGKGYVEALGIGYCGTIPDFQDGTSLLSSPRAQLPDGLPACCVGGAVGGLLLEPYTCNTGNNPCLGYLWPCVLYAWEAVPVPCWPYLTPSNQWFPLRYQLVTSIPLPNLGWYGSITRGGFTHEIALIPDVSTFTLTAWWRTTDPSGPSAWVSAGATYTCSPVSGGADLTNPVTPLCDFVLNYADQPPPVFPPTPPPPDCSTCPSTSFAALNLDVVVNLTNGSCASCNNLNFGCTFVKVGDCFWRSPGAGSLPGIFVCGSNPIHAEVTITAAGGGAINVQAQLIDDTSGLPIVTFSAVKPDCSSTVSFSLNYVSDDGQCIGWAGGSVAVSW